MYLHVAIAVLQQLALLYSVSIEKAVYFRIGKKTVRHSRSFLRNCVRVLGDCLFCGWKIGPGLFLRQLTKKGKRAILTFIAQLDKNERWNMRSYILKLKNKFIGDKKFYKYVLAIAVPVIVQNAVTNFVSFLDNIMVGQIGT